MLHHFSRVSRPIRVDTRADSPMRDETQALHKSPANGTALHGLPTPANDVPSSGFTAVNGEIPRSVSFRPHDGSLATNGHHRTHSGPDSASVTSAAHSHHGWRPNERHEGPSDRDRIQQELAGPQKRKRADSSSTGPRDDAKEDQPHAPGDGSPKRRMTTLNSSCMPDPTRTSQARTHSDEARTLPDPANDIREPSPVYRTDRGQPPPAPRPEVEAGLARSLHATLQPDPAAHDTTPEDDSTDQAHSRPFNPDESIQAADSSDPKKRKRNFSNRTKTGCHTCRGRKKKCDEGKPQCENCKRGNFACGGYGAKPLGGPKPTPVRSVVALQAKHYDPSLGPNPYYDHPGPPPPPLSQYHPSSSSQHPAPRWEPSRPEIYPPPHRYGPPPAPLDHRPPSGRDPWGPRPPWPGAEQTPPHAIERLPPVEYATAPPPMHGYPPDRHLPPDPWGSPSHVLPHYQGPPGPPTVISHESVSTNNSARMRQPLPPIPLPGPPSERKKMVTGQPYKHFLDNELLRDRHSCKRALEAYNKACAASSTASAEEKERCFKMIRDPSERIFDTIPPVPWSGPVGEIGFRTSVEAPFHCEYGYNLKLGNEVVISANCSMEDACLISIGDRTIVGKNVQFLCITTSVDCSQRQGSRGCFTAGAITVESDVVIGTGSIILPFRTIGKGATVGAGSVVTRDVKPYTVVAGNPAKPVRKRKYEPGAPNVDRHDDAIQEENEKMLEEMKKRSHSTMMF